MTLFEPRQTDRRVLYDAALESWITESELRAAIANRLSVIERAGKCLVFLFCRNDLNTVAWYLAGLESRHAIALLDNALAPEFRTRLLELYRPEYVISAERPAQNYTQSGDLGAWQDMSPHEAEIHPNLKQMLSTSGSTGTPKFVRLTGRNVLANAESIAKALGIQVEDCAITTLPIHYSYGLSVLNSHLLAGATIVLTDQSIVSAAFWEAVRQQRCTSFSGVPYSYQMLKRLDIEKLDDASIRIMTQAGEKLSEPLIVHFAGLMQHRGGRFYVMYGQTEATARIAVLPPNRLREKLGSVGLAIPGGHIEMINGEIVYSGPNVMMGYATNRADLAKGDELHGRLHTADTGYLDDENFLYVTGRTKRDTKLFGLRINLDEVEQLLHVHGPAAVIGSENRLIVFCEFGDPARFETLRHELCSKLNVAAIGLEFRKLEKLPTKATGKIDYDLLKTL